MKIVPMIIVVFVFLASNSSVIADNTGEGPAKTVTLSGKVIDKTNQETLAGALIKIEGTDIEVYTDLDGNFTIDGIIPDTYKVTCSMISYSDNEEEITINQKSKQIKINLETITAEQSVR